MWFFFSLSFFPSLAATHVFKDKLKSENSKVLDNWPSLIEKLQSERDLARENAEYLSTLQEYFVVSIIETETICMQYFIFFLLFVSHIIVEVLFEFLTIFRMFNDFSASIFSRKNRKILL